jgi:hypothetical protein
VASRQHRRIFDAQIDTLILGVMMGAVGALLYAYRRRR